MAAKGAFRHNPTLVNYYARFLAQLTPDDLAKTDNAPDAIKREIGPEDLDYVDLQTIDFQMTPEDEEAFSKASSEPALDFCFRYKDFFRLRTTLPEKPKERVIVKDYFPHRFHELRLKFRIALDYSVYSMSNTTSLATTGGKTGSPFYITADRKFVIKEIKGREYVHFRRTFAQEYVDYMLDNSSS